MKRLNKILGKLMTVAGDEPMGACCCKDSNGVVQDCRYSSGLQCGQSYEAYGNKWICTFYDNRSCNEVCFDRVKPLDNTSDNTVDPIDPAIAPTQPGAISPGGTTVPTTPSAPNNLPRRCKSLISEDGELNCVLHAPEGPCKTLLISLLEAWAKNVCPTYIDVCLNDVPPSGPSGPIQMSELCIDCQCGHWKDYITDLKKAAQDWCNGILTCDQLKLKLNQLCVKKNSGINGCLSNTNIGACNDKIIKNRVKNCGMGE